MILLYELMVQTRTYSGILEFVGGIADDSPITDPLCKQLVDELKEVQAV